MLLSINKKDPVAYFIILSGAFAFAQIFYYLKINSILALISTLLLVATLIYALFYLTKENAFFLLFLIIVTRYITGISGRELRDLFPVIFFFLLIIIRPNFIIKTRALPLSFILYALLLLKVIFQDFEFINVTEVTTFFRRWQFFTTLICFLLGFYLSTAVNIKRLNKIFFYFNFAVMVISTTMFVLTIPQIPLFNTYEWMKLPLDNRIGILSSSGAFCILILICNKEVVMRRLWRIGIYMLSFFGIIAGGGRSNLLFLILGYLAYLFFIKKKKVLAISIIAAVVIVTQTGKFVINIDAMPEKYQRVFSLINIEMLSTAFEFIGQDKELEVVKKHVTTSADWSSFARLYMWNRAIIGMSEKPVFGFGIQNPLAGENKRSLDFADRPEHAEDLVLTGTLHNSFFSLAYIAGIPTAVLFVLFMLSCFIKAKRLATTRESSPYNFSFIYITISCINSLTGDVHFSLEFMFFAGLIFSHYKLFYKGNHFLQNI